MEYFSSDLQTGWVVAAHRVPGQTITVNEHYKLFVSLKHIHNPPTQRNFTIPPNFQQTPHNAALFFNTFFFLQISELKPATSYVFLVRGENSHGISVPSGLSTVGKTLGAESGIVPQSELAAARAVLSGKVIIDLASRFAIVCALCCGFVSL